MISTTIVVALEEFLSFSLNFGLWIYSSCACFPTFLEFTNLDGLEPFVFFLPYEI
jgi:hypothetical protein